MEPAPETEDEIEYVTVYISDQLFGLPITQVRNVFKPEAITRVPLSIPEVRGVLNLRGRIVTVIDTRERLGLPKQKSGQDAMAVRVEYKGESYGLLIDRVGEVLRLCRHNMGSNPANLAERWCSASSGVYQLEGGLLVVLEVDQLLDFTGQAHAA